MITTVVANDVDTYPTLTYSWAPAVGPTERKLFAMDRYSGRVSLIGGLDYERAQSYRLAVVVSDSVHTASTELSIAVTDDNDNPPVFDRPYYTFVMTGKSSVKFIRLICFRLLTRAHSHRKRLRRIDDASGGEGFGLRS